MSNMTLTPRVKDTNKLLDFIESVIESVGGENIVEGNFLKAEWENQLQRILVGAFLTSTHTEDTNSPYQIARIQLSIPLCVVYYNLITFLQDMDRNLQLEEIDLANDFGKSTFVSLMKVLHQTAGKSPDKFNEEKLDKWLDMTGMSFKKRKSPKGKSNDKSRDPKSTD